MTRIASVKNKKLMYSFHFSLTGKQFYVPHRSFTHQQLAKSKKIIYLVNVSNVGIFPGENLSRIFKDLTRSS